MSADNPAKPDVPHGALRMALGLALGPAVTIGLARFAYALLLPAMRDDLGWSYAQAGGMNTANALGYLAGAVVAAPIGARIGGRLTFLGGMAITALALLASALSSQYEILLLLRMVAGVAGAVSFVVGGGLAAQVASESGGRAAVALGIYFAGGGGLGIMISALTVPPLLGTTGGNDWRMGWAILGVAALAALAACVPITRRAVEPPTLSAGASGRWPIGSLAPTLLAYGLFGFGYISYMTFVIAFLRGEGVSPIEVSLFWAVLGATAAGSAFWWGPPLQKLGGGRGLATVMGAVVLGAALPLVPLSSASAILGLAFGSAVLFGGSFLAVPTSVTAVAQRALASHLWTRAIGALTVAFAVGQCAGPFLAGVLSDQAAGVRAGLVLSVVVLLVGSGVALLQRDLRYTGNEEDATPTQQR